MDSTLTGSRAINTTHGQVFPPPGPFNDENDISQVSHRV